MTDESDGEIEHRELSTDEEDEPAVRIAEIVAELEGADVADLAPIFDQVDHVLDHIFSNPPAPDAQVEITFTYEGYRITVEQNGLVELVPV